MLNSTSNNSHNNTIFDLAFLVQKERRALKLEQDRKSREKRAYYTTGKGE